MSLPFIDFQLLMKNAAGGVVAAHPLYMWGDNTYGQLGDSKTPNYYSWSQISVGDGHTLAIRSDYTLWVWGKNDVGQLGDATTVNKSTPTNIPLPSTTLWSTVYAGGSQSMAIDSAFVLYSWGNNRYGQLVLGDTVNRSSPVQVTTGILSANVGINHVGVITSAYVAKTGGYNNYGQLGDSTTVGKSSLTNVSSGPYPTINSVYFEGTSTYLTASGALSSLTQTGNPFTIEFWAYCISVATDTFFFGLNPTTSGLNVLLVGPRNYYVNGPTSTTWTSGAMPANTWMHIAVVYNGSQITVYKDGTLWETIASALATAPSTCSLCIGAEFDGAGGTIPGNYFTGYLSNLRLTTIAVYTGNFTVSTIPLATTQSSGTNISAITSSQVRLLTLQLSTTITDNSTYNNTVTSYGTPTISTTVTPAFVNQPASVSFTQISAGNNFTTAIGTDGIMYGWGDNTYGQLGLNETGLVTRSAPTQIGYSSWSIVSSGKTHTAAIDANSNLFTFGNDYYGQLGLSRSPLTGKVYTQISKGTAHTLVIDILGKLYAYGLNNAGQLGTGDTINRSSPTQIGTSSWSQVFAGSSYSTAITSDGKLYLWGLNSSYQLGTTDSINRSSPVQVSGDRSWINVGAGESNTLGVQSDNSLWGWGNNTFGQLGGEKTVFGTSWTKIVSGDQHTLGIKQDGTLWAWGLNSTGQLGINNTLNRSSPVQIGTETYTDIATGLSHSLAIRSNGTLWGWGLNSSGQVNLSWVQVASGLSHTLLLRSDGAIWSYGLNSSGQLGNNSTTNRSSPVQVGTTNNYVYIAAGNNVSAGITSNGNLYTWGLATSGQLGVTPALNRSNPTQVGESWSIVSMSDYTLATNSQGYLWSWGTNTNGQLGLNDTVNRKQMQLVDGSSTTYSAGFADNEYFTSPSSDYWSFGTGDFTVETWYYAQSFSGSITYTEIAGQFANDYATPGLGLWEIEINGSVTPGQIIVYYDNYTLSFTSNINLSTYTWYHIALVRFGSGTNNLVLYINGVNSGSATFTGQLGRGVSSGVPLSIGAQQFGGYVGNVKGYLSNLRIVKGLAVYTGNFTVPTSPLTATQSSGTNIQAITNQTVLLTFQSSTFVDNSGLSNTLTMTGNPAINKFNPFGVTSSVSWSAVAAGSHSLAITNNKLYTWGLNSNGQLGINDTLNRSSPVQVAGSWSTVAASTTGHSLATKSDNTLFAWGFNSSGELGLASSSTVADFDNRSSPVQVGTSSWTSIKAGSGYSIGTDINNSLYVWGTNSIGQLGIVNLISYSQAGTGYAKRSDGSIYVWSNVAGLTLGRSSPIQLDASTNTSFVVSNTLGRYLIKNDGTLYSWGDNTYGQLGTSDTVTRSSPTQVSGSWSTIASYGSHAVAIKSDGTLYGWGLNNAYQLGLNDTVNRSSPTLITTGSWSKVATGASHSLAIKSDGTLWTWGLNSSMQLGFNDTVTRSVPIQLGTSTWTTVTAGNAHSLGILSTSVLYAWGSNSNGQLGTNLSTINRSSPVQVTTSSWVAVSAGDLFTVGIKSDNTLWSWGNNAAGQLGYAITGVSLNRSSPTQIGTSTWSSVNAGASFTYGVKSDNTLYAWGLNGAGQLGVQDTINRSSPVQLGYTFQTTFSYPTVYGTSSFTQVSAGASTTVFKNTYDGYVYTTGYGGVGQLGNNAVTINRSTPVQVVTSLLNTTFSSPVQISSGSWSSVSAGNSHSIGISNNTVYVWGDNTYGQLGDSSSTTRSVINNITGSYTSVSAGFDYNLAISSNYNLYSWGRNNNYQLGTGDTSNRSSPVQVGLGVSYTQVSGGGIEAYAIDNVGQLYGWGNNSYGQLALGSAQLYGYFSGYFSGSAYAYYDQNLVRFFGSDATIEAWIYPTTSASILTICSNSTNGGSTGSLSFVFVVNTNGSLRLYSHPTGVYFNIVTAAGAITTNTWTHVAFTRIGTAMVLYVNGVNSATGTIDAGASGNFGDSYPLQVGRGVSGSNFIGYISNFRILYGTALYTSNFTPQTSPLSVITNTQILTLLGDTIQDYSGNGWNYTNFSITPAYYPLSPFLPPTGASSYPSILDTTKSYSSITAGNTHVVAMRTDKTVYAWGDNSYGQLDTNDTLARSSPVQIGSTSYNSILGKSRYGINLSIPGTAVMIGLNSSGQLGLNDTLNRSSPVNIASTNTTSLTSPTRLGLDSWTAVAAGYSHTAAIKADYTLYTWGSGVNGRTGLLIATNRSSPVQVTGGGSWIIVTASKENTGGMRTDNSIWVWGNNATGQLGDTTTLSRSSPVQLGTGYFWNDITIGESSSVIIRDDNTIFAWGNNAFGSLGQGDTVARSSPIQIGSTRFSTVMIGANDTTIIDPYGTLYSIGDAKYGNLGDNALIFYSWIQVATGLSHTLAIRSDNTLWIWGGNAYGQLGQNDLVGRSSPTLISGSWIYAAAGWGSSAAIKSDYTLWSWGINNNGQLGSGDAVSKSSPTQVTIGGSWTKVSFGLSNMYAIKTDSTMYSAGITNLNGLGPNTGDKSTLTQISGSWSNVSAGASFATAIDTTGALYTWGYNANSGQLGVPTAFSWTDVIYNNTAGIALRNDGTIWTWGTNTNGQLGDGTTANRTSPVQISSKSWLAIGSAFVTGNPGAMFAIDNTYNLYAWGNNTNGVLGAGDVIPRSSPTQIGAGESWLQVTKQSGSFASAITTDGKLFTWGTGASGVLGSGNTLARSAPVQITSPSASWIMVAGQFSTLHALTNTNILYGTGINTAGQIGDGTTVNKSSLTVVTSSILTMSSGGGHTVALKTDNSLWIWGSNQYAQLGTGDTLNRSSPVQISQFSGSSFTLVSAGLQPGWTLALDTNKNLWAWGDNSSGKLGVGDAISRSSPIQITTLSVNEYPTKIFTTTTASIFFTNKNNHWTTGTTTVAEPTLATSSNYPTQQPLQIISAASPLKVGNSSWLQVSAGQSHILAIRNDNTLWGWGLGTSGQISNTISYNVINADGALIRSDGIIYTWGLGTSGQIGDNTIVTKSSPVTLANTVYYASTYSWTSVISGSISKYAIRADSTLFGWGLNTSGQFGDSTTQSRSFPTQIFGGSYSQIASGDSSLYVIDTNGKLFATGSNYTRQLGLGDSVYRSSPTQVATGSSFSQVAAGKSFVIAKRSDGTLWGWGDNTYNQLGTSSTQISWTTVAVNSHVVAIRSDNTLWTWGLNSIGQLGLGDTVTRSSPTQITGSWSQIGLGDSYVAAIKTDGTLYTWGNNPQGQLGTNDSYNRSSPTQVSGSYSFVTAGYSHTIAIRSDNTLWGWGDNTLGALGTTVPLSWTLGSSGMLHSDGSLWLWGYNANGELGVNDNNNRSSPVQVGYSSWSMMSARNSNTGTGTFGIKQDGTLWAWGLNSSGQLGVNDTIARSSPIQVSGGGSWTYITTSSNATAGIKNDGTLWYWGSNPRKILGTNDTISRSAPVQIGSSTNWQIAELSNHPGGTTLTLFAINTLGELWSVGYGSTGTLGNGTSADRSIPVQIATSPAATISWSQVTAGTQFAAAIDTTGKLYTWGINTFGQLGTADTINRSYATQIDTANTYSKVVALTSTVVAIRSDGSLWSWGAGGATGQLGQLSDITNKSAPTQIGSLTTWSQITPGVNTGFATTTNGNLYAWGSNANANVGDNTTTNRSSPVQIGTTSQAFNLSPVQIGTSSWSKVSAGLNHTLAIKTDSTLYAWGLNNAGQVGSTDVNATGDTINRSSPVQLGTSSFSQVSAGSSLSTAITSDGKLFTWGLNNAGQLGQSNTTSRSSPVQITGSDSYVSVSAGNSFVLAVKTDGTLWTWGLNNNNQLGIALTTNRSIPVQLGTSSYSLIAAGANNSAGIINNNLYIWGLNTSNQASTSDTVARSSPTQVGTSLNTIEGNPIQISSDSWTSISTHYNSQHVLGIRNNTVYAWGRNNVGQLGLTTDTVSRSSPTQVSSLTGSYTLVSAGGSASAVLKSDNTIYAWGDNQYGQLVQVNTINRSIPTQITTTTITYNSVSMGDGTILGLDTTNTILLGAGLNTSGQLGDSTAVNKSNWVLVNSTNLTSPNSPVQITTKSWTKISSGGLFSTAIDDSGYLFTWGLNGGGQLGLIDSVSRSSPTQINASSYSILSAGYSFAFASVVDPALLGGSTLFAWGQNTSGQFGDGTVTSRSSPVVAAIYTTVESKSSPVQVGTFGYGNYLRSSPTQVGTSSWVGISSGYNHTTGIDKNYNVFTWGRNTEGELGISDTINRSSPVQISTLSSITIIGSGNNYTMALKSDGTGYGFGDNTYGQLGDGT